MTKDYVLVIDSNDGVGYYNLSIEGLDSAPADIGISSLVCPTNHTSGSEVQITWELVSLRGSANAATITLHLDLIDSEGEEVARITTKTVVVSGEYNTDFRLRRRSLYDAGREGVGNVQLPTHHRR